MTALDGQDIYWKKQQEKPGTAFLRPYAGLISMEGEREGGKIGQEKFHTVQF